MPKKDSKSIIASGRLEDELLALKLGVERADQAIFITDKEGVIFYINPAFEKMYGYTEKEALGNTPRILKSDKEPQSMYEHFWDTLLNKKVVDLDIINKTKDGRFLIIKATANPILNKANEIIGFLSIQSDITERIEEHKKLIEAERNYRDIVDNSPDMIHSVDKDGYIVFANKKECKILGYKPDELIGKHISDIYSKKLTETVKNGFKKLKEEGKLYVPDGKMIGKDGKEIDVEIDSITIKDDKGGFIRTRSIIRDVTERRYAQEKYKILFESSRDAIMTLDPPSWNFTSGNPATIKMFDCDGEQDFISHAPWQYSPHEQPDGQLSDLKAKEMILKAMETGSNFFQWTHRRKNGEDFPATILLTRVTVGDKTFLQATVRDITEQKQAEDELKKKIEQMEFMGRVNLKRYKKMIQMQKKIIDLKKRLGEEAPSADELEEFMPKEE